MIFEESDAKTVRLRKAEPLDPEFLSALQTTLTEWNSENDERATVTCSQRLLAA